MVLIAHSNADTRRYLLALLESLGYSVRFCAGLDEAWTLIFEKVPKLVILEPATPGCPELQFMNKVRNHVLTRSVQVCSVTGPVPFTHLRNILINGAAYAYILPIDENEFKPVTEFLMDPARVPSIDGEVAKALVAEEEQQANIMAYGRIGYLNADSFKIESNLKTKPDQELVFQHGLLSKFLTPWLKLKVATISTNNLYYNYKQASVIKVPKSEETLIYKVKKYIKENKNYSSPKRVKVLVIGANPAVTKALQSVAGDDQPFSVRVVQSSKNLKFDVDYYQPVLVLMDVSQQSHGGKPAVVKSLRALGEAKIPVATFEREPGDYTKLYQEFPDVVHAKRDISPELTVELIKRFRIIREAKGRTTILPDTFYFSKTDPNSRVSIMVATRLVGVSERSITFKSKLEFFVGANIELESRLVTGAGLGHLFLKVKAVRRASGELPFEHEALIIGRTEWHAQRLRKMVNDILTADKRKEWRGEEKKSEGGPDGPPSSKNSS